MVHWVGLWWTHYLDLISGPYLGETDMGSHLRKSITSLEITAVVYVAVSGFLHKGQKGRQIWD